MSSDHQHIDGTSLVFSAAVPGLLAVSVSESINESGRRIQAVLDHVEAITIPSHTVLPIVHIHLRSATSSSVTLKKLNPATPAPREPPSFDIAG
ncbi:hypothetical protein V8E53_002917 [Lactarius tabidus]